MALQPRPRNHQAYAQLRGHPVSTSKEGQLLIQIIKRSKEKPMGAVSAFTKGNYHCKPLMTDKFVRKSRDEKYFEMINFNDLQRIALLGVSLEFSLRARKLSAAGLLFIQFRSY